MPGPRPSGGRREPAKRSEAPGGRSPPSERGRSRAKGPSEPRERLLDGSRSGGPYLIFGHYSVMPCGRMAQEIKSRTEQPGYYAKIYMYPGGIRDIVASTSPDFREKGWEAAEDYSRPKEARRLRDKTSAGASEDLERSRRRARGRVRRLALANDFRWFVTLTLDPAKIDRYDPQEVVRKLSQWCSNQVKRRGMKYILVPERHKDGALHFHGFFNDCLEAVDSGHKDKQGHAIYNLPGWTLGFTAAVEVYGDYAGAVAYVCKYIGKQGDKPAGRWYYSGGALAEPEVIYADLGVDEVEETFGGRAFSLNVPGRKIVVVNGIKEE